MTKLFYIIGVTTMIVGFQNCAKTSFTAASGDSTMQALSGGDKNGTTPDSGTGTGDATGNLTQDGSNTCQEAPGTNVIEPGKMHTSCANEKHDPTVDPCDTDPSSDLVACILPGPGKSVKLGLVNGALAGVNGVDQSVCISKSECLGDISKSFGVSAAYVRGYCDHNPNVQSLTDAQVKKLLGI